MRLIIVIAFSLVACLPSFAADAESRKVSPAVVAGLSPHQRPKGAPVLREFANDAWQAKSLRGIAEPVPAGLGFMKSQGAWYSPFGEAGMPSYYDWRGFHQPVGKTRSPR